MNKTSPIDISSFRHDVITSKYFPDRTDRSLDKIKKTYLEIYICFLKVIAITLNHSLYIIILQGVARIAHWPILNELMILMFRGVRTR